MTQPRTVLPGTTVMITRRTLRRTHLFRPDPDLTRLYLYTLAVVAKRYGVAVHAVVLMSTHEHLIVTDRRGTLPRFLRELHRLVALGVKTLRKWEGAVWDHERPSVVHLKTPEAILEKLAYVMANPVAAGLVHKAKDWPGVQTLPEQLGCTQLVASRPDVYFDKDNPLWPQHASLSLVMPQLPEMTDDEIREAVRAELAECELQARANVKANRRSVMGAERVRRGSPYDRAKSWDPLRGRNPQFAVGRAQKQAFIAAATALQAFRRAYREALDRWRTGVRSVWFPAGTWIMSTLHAAQVLPIS